MLSSIVSLQSVTKTFDRHPVLDRLDLDIRQGEFLSLLGPSGCGKTTVLRLIAGLEPVSDGTIYLDGQDVTAVPPHRRNVNTVFQSYALFPHLSVFDNVAFGLKINKLPKTEIRTRVENALQMVQMESMATRSVTQLSGGQQQRVAIARALVNNPKVLLLDEPLSALDYKLRKAMQLELKHLHQRLGITFVFVTHDQEEAMVMSDRIAVMNEGRIEQIGTPKEIYEQPRNLYVAKFVGESNLFDATVEAVEGSQLDVSIAGEHFTLTSDRPFRPGDRVKVLLRPEDLVVYYEEEACELPYMWGVVDEYLYKGTTVDVRVTLDSGHAVIITEFFNENEAEIEYAPKQRVKIAWHRGWEVVLPDE